MESCINLLSANQICFKLYVLCMFYELAQGRKLADTYWEGLGVRHLKVIVSQCSTVVFPC